MTIVSCKTDFTAQEREVIHAGDREIMYVLSVAEPEDSLQLREVCLPVSERMLQGEDYATLRRRMLATVQDPENEGVGIAAPQVQESTTSLFSNHKTPTPRSPLIA